MYNKIGISYIGIYNINAQFFLYSMLGSIIIIGDSDLNVTSLHENANQ